MECLRIVLLGLEQVAGFLVVENGVRHIDHVGLVELSDYLKLLGGHDQTTHVDVNVARLQQAVERIVRTRLAKGIRRLVEHVGRLVLRILFQLNVGRRAERFAGFRPALGHFERVTRFLE